MADQEKDMADIEAELDSDQAWAIAGKVLEMCDRVAGAEKFAPGGQARWVLTVDDKQFVVTVEIDRLGQ